MTIPADVKREQAETRRAILAAELAALWALRRTPRTQGALAAVLAARAATAERLARDRLGAEMLAAGVPLTLPPLGRLPAPPLRRGAERPLTVGQRVRRAVAGILGGPPGDGGLRRVAAAETWGVVGETRARLTQGLAVEVTETVLYRVWDATLDHRTCPRCAGADGSAVPVGEAFREGTPGSVHPFCRCTEWVLPVEMTTTRERRRGR